MGVVEVKHTPGPWFIANGNEIHDRPTSRDENGARIGETPNLIATVEDIFPWSDRQNRKKANAQLIAAAPDLLEALETLLSHRDYLEEGTPLTAVVLPLVENAIAKAEGRTA